MKKEKTPKVKEKKRRKHVPGEFSSSRVIRWEKLDNTANLFPVIASEGTTNVYRISVTLSEEINPEILQEALDLVLPRFDGFNVRLREGFFWYYFEENGKPAPRVTKETEFPCRYIHANKNNSYLFRVTYYEKRINLEVFHVLTDGMGGINFIRELAYQYLRLVHPELRNNGDTLSEGTSLNREDSFVRNFREKKPRLFQSQKAFLIRGEELPDGELGLIHGYLPFDQLKAATKRYSVSINEYLVAVFAYSTYKEAYRGGKKAKAIRIAVPVNLRPYYDSVTTKNFFVIVSATFDPRNDKEKAIENRKKYSVSCDSEKEFGEYTFEDVLHIVADDLRSQINKEHLENLFSYGVANQENLFLRCFPLPIKRIAMKFVYNMSALAHTTTITNIGRIPVDKAYEQYITAFHAFLTMSKGQMMKGTICSYGDNLTFTFSTRIADTAIERTFFRQLVSDGIEPSVETNGEFV